MLELADAALIIGDAANINKPVSLLSDYIIADFELHLSVRTFARENPTKGGGHLLIGGRLNKHGQIEGVPVYIGGDRWGAIDKKAADNTGHEANAWRTLSIKVTGHTIETKVDGKTVAKQSIKSLPSRGLLALVVQPGAIVQIKDLELKLIKSTP